MMNMFFFYFSSYYQTNMNTTEYLNKSDPTLPMIDFELLQSYIRLQNIIRYLEIIWAYGIAPFGLLGSVLTLLALRHTNLSETGSGFSFYLPTIAVFDALRLLVGSISMIVRDAVIRSSLVCKVLYFTVTQFAFMSYFLVVAISIDRSIAISMPHKAKVLSTAKSAKITTAVLFALLLTGTSSCLVMYDTHPVSGYCFVNPDYAWLERIISSIGLSLTVIPSFMMFVCSFVIIYQLKTQNQRMKELTGEGHLQSYKCVCLKLQNR